MSQVDDIQFLPTYGAFEKYDPEGGVDSLLGQLPPRLRKNASVHEDFIDFHETVKSSMEVGRPEQILFVGAGNIDRWAHAMAAMSESGEIASVRFNLFAE